MQPEKLTKAQLIDTLKKMQRRIKQLELEANEKKYARKVKALAECKKKVKLKEIDSYLLDALMKNIPDAIYFKDTKSRFIRNSKAHIKKWFKQSNPDLVIGKSDFDFFSYDHAKKAYADEQNIIKTGQPLEAFEEKETWPDGHITWVSTSKMPLHDQNGKIIGTFGLSQDITQRKQAEEKLQNTARKLEQSNRKLLKSNRELQKAKDLLTKANIELNQSNQELEQFAYMASHDLQEPLRMIGAFAGLLERKIGEMLDEEGKEFIFYLTDGAKRMQALINDLLQFSRISTQVRPYIKTDLNEVLRRAIDSLQIQIDETRTKITHDPLPVVWCDEIKYERVFQNLIANAIKYCRKEPHIHISATQEKKVWLISVQDNGIGIAPQFKEKIFGLFQRLHQKNEYSGTGIGLAICKKIIERHGGRIWVESKTGTGSTFFFTHSMKSRHK
jgi:PAS domain S-box-containing protein